MGNFAFVNSNVAKAHAIPGISVDAITTEKLKLSSAISHLVSGNYYKAAEMFLDCNVDIGSNFNEVSNCFN